MSTQRIGVLARLGRLLCGEGCFGHHRTQFVVIGGIGHDAQLFIDLGQFNTQTLETFCCLRQTTLH